MQGWRSAAEAAAQRNIALAGVEPPPDCSRLEQVRCSQLISVRVKLEYFKFEFYLERVDADTVASGVGAGSCRGRRAGGEYLNAKRDACPRREPYLFISLVVLPPLLFILLL